MTSAKFGYVFGKCYTKNNISVPIMNTSNLSKIGAENVAFDQPFANFGRNNSAMLAHPVVTKEVVAW